MVTTNSFTPNQQGSKLLDVSRNYDWERHVVFFSGGITSWACAKRVKATLRTTQNKHESRSPELLLLFCDTRMEDEDLYRFLHEAAKDVDAPLITIADGRTPWQVFNDVGFLGNSRIRDDVCALKSRLQS